MLSKALVRSKPSWVCLQLCRSSTTASSAANTPSWVDGPERDLVNFPRIKPLVNPSPVRMGFIPQGWFDMFYDKTGVTGPYMLGAGVATFLISKEWYVLDHEFYAGLIMYPLYAYGIIKFGPAVAEHCFKETTEYNKGLDSLRDLQIESNEEGIKNNKESIVSAENQTMLFQAKKENIKLQLEAAYRERMQSVYEEVKKRLDYQLETSNVKQRFEQKHMVEWIDNSVRQSITPAVEDAVLKQCFADLKILAAKA